LRSKGRLEFKNRRIKKARKGSGKKRRGKKAQRDGKKRELKVPKTGKPKKRFWPTLSLHVERKTETGREKTLFQITTNPRVSKKASPHSVSTGECFFKTGQMGGTKKGKHKKGREGHVNPRLRGRKGSFSQVQKNGTRKETLKKMCWVQQGR